jgi:hypothetical protein
VCDKTMRQEIETMAHINNKKEKVWIEIQKSADWLDSDYLNKLKSEKDQIWMTKGRNGTKWTDRMPGKTIMDQENK